MNYCISCGTKLDPLQRYCTKCNAEVSGNAGAQIEQIEKKQSAESSHPGEKLKIDRVGSTLLGLFTCGIWWTLFIRKWSELHLRYYKDKLTYSDNAQSSEILNSVQQSTNRALLLSSVTLVMLSAGLAIIIISFIWEVLLDIGVFPLPEGLFWFYCWVSLSMLAVTWASVLLGIFKALKLQSSSWYPLNGSSEIISVTVLWCVVALGLLPLLIFPPIYAGSVNKYVSILIE